MKRAWDVEKWGVTRRGECYVSYRYTVRLRGPLWPQRCWLHLFHPACIYYTEPPKYPRKTISESKS